MQDLKEKIVIVTGGSGLLGSQFCSAIEEIGGQSISLDIEPGNNSEYFYCDICNEKNVVESLEEIKKHFPKKQIYGLINNAALNPKMEVEENLDLPVFPILEQYSIDKWNQELSVGLTGALICTKVFGREMIKNGLGVIINISSYLGIMAPNQDFYARFSTVKPVGYTVVKHAIIGLTKHVATEWAEYNIRCNTLAPHGVYNSHDEEFVKKYIENIPLKRMAGKSEYNEAIKFLLTDASKYMTGQTLIMDGGHSIW